MHTTGVDISADQFKNDIRHFFSRVNWASQTNSDDLRKIFKPSCFYFTDNPAKNDVINRRITKFSKIFIAGEEGDFNQFMTKLKSYDFSAMCGLVWTANYFGYRCGTCAISPNMSLCAPCFINGNHTGHDFHKFKSQAGGTCDCGNKSVMKEIGYCQHHGPNKIGQQREPADSLIGRFKLLMPIYLESVLVASWSLMSAIEKSNSSANVIIDDTHINEVLHPIMSFINELLDCGWVTHKIIAGILINKEWFSNFINEYKDTRQYCIYDSALRSEPDFKFPEDKVGSQKLQHGTLLDAFMFVCVKLRFPGKLVVFLIGLLTMDGYKEALMYSYINHYSRLASTLLSLGNSARNRQDDSYDLNHRVDHMSVQLFSDEVLARQMIIERDVHYLIVHCLLNMFQTTLMQLDSSDTKVIDCETLIIRNTVFWPLMNDFQNIIVYKSLADILIADPDFMKDWIQLLKWMQFMNFFVLKEDNHIEYETMSYFYAYTLEIEISVNSMWHIWNHYSNETEMESALKVVQTFVSALADYINNLGNFKIKPSHSAREPLSFHLPLMRNVACFLSLALTYHHLPLTSLLENINVHQLTRWFKETSNTLLGFHEVLIGYWARNRLSLRTSTTSYTDDMLCCSFIEMDIFAAQICASVIPCSTVIYILTDPTLLLKGFTFSCVCKEQTAFLELGSEKQSLALEAWLMNLCWILDLRTATTVDDENKLRKEICSKLCTEPIRRSDLYERLPARLSNQVKVGADVDSILNKVAYFTAPTFDEYSCNLQSSLYSFKPELWDTDYDPIFHSIRSSSKSVADKALDKYREYNRRKHNLTFAKGLWPPYKIPPPPHAELLQLECILHCKDLTYIIFCSLNMFLNNIPSVTEDSLALIIHLIHRSLTVTPPPHTSRDTSDGGHTRFFSNPYKVNDMFTNIRHTIELYSEDATNMSEAGARIQEGNKNHYRTVQRESILSLLLKIHSKLHTQRLQAGNKCLSSTTPSKLIQNELQINGEFKTTVDGLYLSLSFFDTYPLVYEYNTENLQKAKDTGIGINWGDGVDFIGHLLDIIASKNDENSKSLLYLIDDINHLTSEKNPDSADGRQSEPDSTLKRNNHSLRVIESVTDKKRKAIERRRILFEAMALKQQTFANTHQLDLEDVLVKEDDKVMYECVICQIESDPNKDKMVLLGILCSASLLKYMTDKQRHNGDDKTVLYRKDYIGKVLINRPFISNDVIIQTCGHVVHQDCFDRYRAQMTAMKLTGRTITCPICRREVHHMTPIQTHVTIPSSSNSFFATLKSVLFESLNTDFVGLQSNIFNNSIVASKAIHITAEHQACSLLRNQLELELIICLVVPNRYGSITKRCIWPEFIFYIRTLNVSIETLITQSDMLFGTMFLDDISMVSRDISYNPIPLLFRVPTDVLLNFVPFVWPHEDHLMSVVKASLVMAYIKGMVMISSTLDNSEYIHWSKLSHSADPFLQQFSLILKRCSPMYNTSVVTQEPLLSTARSHDSIINDLVNALLPVLRIAAVLKLRLTKQNQIPDDFPITTIDSAEHSDYRAEFNRLCEYLCLTRPALSLQKWSDHLTNLFSVCLRETLFEDFAHVMSAYINSAFMETYINETENKRSNNSSLNILNIGNELYPPQLIDLPINYDDLFNTYHSRKCDNTSKTRVHNSTENALCLICGEIVCLICDSIWGGFREHTKACCCGMCLLLDVNTSIIYVLLNNEVGQWGSVYLDHYGEEDLKLKRGRPLFINRDRLKLLEQQWLTHSLKQVVKSWRKIFYHDID